MEAPSFKVQVIGGITYGVSLTIGNLLRFGIIHFERYGGDPMKRSFGNHMISFIFEVSCVNLVMPGSLIGWYNPTSMTMMSVVNVTAVGMFQVFCQWTNWKATCFDCHILSSTHHHDHLLLTDGTHLVQVFAGVQVENVGLHQR